jgi:AAA15 family ATPase/GTPase
MGTFKGTKGKWLLTHNGYYFDILILRTDKKNINASVFCSESTEESGFQPKSIDQETSSKALLISKAPEMLDMLEKVVLKLKGNGFPSLQREIEQLIKEATEL